MGEGNSRIETEGKKKNPINESRSWGLGGQEQALCIDNNTLNRNEHAVTF